MQRFVILIFGETMIEIRFVDDGRGNLQLQQRTRLPRVDCNGAFCDFTGWSNWTAVEIIHDASQVVSVVDVFYSGKGSDG